MAPARPPADSPSSVSASIRRRARELGFDLIGIAPAERPAHAGFYLEWLERGHAGEMAYLARADAVARRLDPTEILPGARSIIVVAMNYNNGDDGPTDAPSRPVIARYGRGFDYHLVFEDKLGRLADSLTDLPGGCRSRCYVDYGPVLERDHAQRAGLGWIGKNTVLIHPEVGSYLFLGEIITDAELSFSEPFIPDHCGTCERCIEACPTGAIRAPRELDSRLCISYLTIELRGPIPRELRPLIGNRIFGCDICQDVCPWNKEAPQSRESRFQPRENITGLELIEFMSLTDDEFRDLYSDTPLARAKREGFLRNVAVALGNWGDPAALPALLDALDDDSPLIRGHAAWALGRLQNPTADAALEAHVQRESDPWVRSEIGFALGAEPAGEETANP
jgi:epoxyqueuosine reductase